MSKPASNPLPPALPLLIAAALLSFGGAFFVPDHVHADGPAADLAPSISPAELSARREAGTAPEYAAGHIPDAIHIPHDQVAERIDSVEAPNGVALYCMLGPRARLGEADLLANGYESVLHIEGGLQAWQAAGLPVTPTE